uniref:Uncharacterized protein n=1 Tax=Parascaris univalens TaxID=6257 RepID=A0A914ZSC8_PARUN
MEGRQQIKTRLVVSHWNRMSHSRILTTKRGWLASTQRVFRTIHTTLDDVIELQCHICLYYVVLLRKFGRGGFFFI